MPDIPHSAISALILAGGQANRMGGVDKGLLDCGGRPLIEWVLERIPADLGQILISANRHQDSYAHYGHPVVGDAQPDYPGPLAGIEAGLRACTTDFLWVLPCDAPAVAPALLQRLRDTCLRTGCRAAVPVTEGHPQPTFALLQRDVLPSLSDFLAQGQRKTQDWLAGLPALEVDCTAHPDWFANINTPEALADWVRARHDTAHAHAR